MMKKSFAQKLIAVPAATVILLTSLAGGSAYAATTFNDLKNVPQASQILALQEAGILKGTADGKFNPQGTFTNAQAIQLVVETFDLNIDDLNFIKKPEASDSFPKASDQAWYADALVIAAYSDLNLPRDLDPNAPATRASFASLLINAGQSSGALPMFRLIPVEITDEADIPDGSSGSMQEALAFGILELDAEGNIHPNKELTRAQAADLLYKITVKAGIVETK